MVFNQTWWGIGHGRTHLSAIQKHGQIQKYPSFVTKLLGESLAEKCTLLHAILLVLIFEFMKI